MNQRYDPPNARDTKTHRNLKLFKMRRNVSYSFIRGGAPFDTWNQSLQSKLDFILSSLLFLEFFKKCLLFVFASV